MPGAFAHITAVNQALIVGNHHLPSRLQRILTVYHRYVEMGSVSPDFPYLNFSYLNITEPNQADWANRMHYEQVGELLRRMIRHVSALCGELQDRTFAWLSGFLAHVITDITIHPIIELKVGDYRQNKQQHRLCEMHQDAYIWQRMGVGHIGCVERISRHLLYCADFCSPNQIDKSIKQLWHDALVGVFGQRYGTPDIDSWFRAFIRVIELVEDEYRLFPFSRHVAAFLGLVYPQIDEINSDYIENLQTPDGPQHYNQIFDFSVRQIVVYQKLLAKSVYEGGTTDWLKNWNLDTGLCENGILTIWESNKVPVA